MSTRAIRSVCLALGMAVSASAANAAPVTIINFGSDNYITDPAVPATGNAVLDVPLNAALNEFRDIGTSPLSPPSLLDDPAAPNNRFYGGVGFFTDDPTAARSPVVDTAVLSMRANTFENGAGARGVSHSTDRIYLQSQETNVVGGNDTYVILNTFAKEDFLAGSSALDLVSLDDDSSYSFSAGTLNNSDVGSRFARLVIKQDGEYFIQTNLQNSGNSFSTNRATNITRSLDLNSFVEYDPGASLLFEESSANVPFSGVFDDIEAIGLYVESSRFGGDAQLRLFSSGLIVDATVTPVPEPGAIAMLGLGLACVLRRRRLS